MNSKTEPEIRELFGIEVELHKPGAGPVRMKVLGVETSTSIANQKNIFVLVDDTDPKTVASGSEIHSIGPARNGAP